MRLRTGFLALIASTVLTPAALAECSRYGVRFHLSQNESVATSGTSTKGSACSHRFWVNGTQYYTSGAITSRPSHGTLTQSGMLNFRYQPASGFKGADRYSLKICGKDGGGSGCATITYNITVE
jgi:hypothetical protein